MSPFVVNNNRKSGSLPGSRWHDAMDRQEQAKCVMMSSLCFCTKSTAAKFCSFWKRGLMSSPLSEGTAIFPKIQCCSFSASCSTMGREAVLSGQSIQPSSISVNCQYPCASKQSVVALNAPKLEWRKILASSKSSYSKTRNDMKVSQCHVNHTLEPHALWTETHTPTHSYSCVLSAPEEAVSAA